MPARGCSHVALNQQAVIAKQEKSHWKDMEWHQTANCIEKRLQTIQRMHRLNGISELMALADYCTKYKLTTKCITKEKHDALIDLENSDGAWVLHRNGGIRLKITSESGEVILSLRIEDNIWNSYAEHVADWHKLAENAKALFQIPSKN
ncbi:hypothetical protein [Synechococcus sp. MIT S9508]|uniref:hypothetical protein n=1 Tax=Synechococcus sp. MIT S9508 TaxID=1801629 RepID=UPI0012E6F2CF|nr:hypothetical protein [Synechococcus sp. MIT S9508]